MYVKHDVVNIVSKTLSLLVDKIFLRSFNLINNIRLSKLLILLRSFNLVETVDNVNLIQTETPLSLVILKKFKLKL